MNGASLTRTSRKRYLIRGVLPRVLLCSIFNDSGVISLFQRNSTRIVAHIKLVRT